MALMNRKAPIPATGTGIALFSLQLENRYKPTFQPKVRFLDVMASAGKRTRFGPDRPFKEVEKQFTEYLVSLELPPGRYNLGEVNGYSKNFWMGGRFKFPINAGFNVAAGRVVYVGHVSMVNRERKEGETRSGGVFPLVDQAATGFSGGTFDIEITDCERDDLAKFTQAYPHFKPEGVQKAILLKTTGVGERK